MTSNVAKVAGKMYLAPKMMKHGTQTKNIRDIKGMEGASEPFAACYNGHPPMRKDLHCTAVC